MSRLKLNHWFVKDNGLDIALMRFYIEIKVTTDLNCVLRVTDGERQEEVFEFNTLEEAVNFTEEKIINCKNIEEIPKLYKEQLLNNKQDEQINCESINLSKSEVNKIIVDYYGEGRPNVTAKHVLKLEDDKIDIDFYLVEEFNLKRKQRIVEKRLTENDLRVAFDDYLEGSNYKLVDYKYIGGIRRVGYFVDENKPYYEGIKLFIKGREKIK